MAVPIGWNTDIKAGAQVVRLDYEVEVVLMVMEPEAGRSLCLMIRKDPTSSRQLTFGFCLCKRDINFHLRLCVFCCLFYFVLFGGGMVRVMKLAALSNSNETGTRTGYWENEKKASDFPGNLESGDY